MKRKVSASAFGLSAIFTGVLLLSASGLAQIDTTAPAIANPANAAFSGLTEDWTTPSLKTSHLRPIRPVGFFDDSHLGYTVELLQMQWRAADSIDLYVMKPKGVKNPPVILYLFTSTEDTDVFKNEDFQKAVTKDGFAAVGFVTALTGHRFHDRPMTQWFVSELQESLATSAHDVQMVLTYMSARGDLDMGRVGMFGQGSGASVAILASAVDARIKVLDVLDPWGDWPVWLAKSPFVPEDERSKYVKADFLKKAGMLDPVDWLPKVQAKKFRFQDAVFEAKTPKVAKEKLWAAAPSGTRFVFYKTEAEFDPVFKNSVNLEWMEHELTVLPEWNATPRADENAVAQSQ